MKKPIVAILLAAALTTFPMNAMAATLPQQTSVEKEADKGTADKTKTDKDELVGADETGNDTDPGKESDPPKATKTVIYIYDTDEGEQTETYTYNEGDAMPECSTTPSKQGYTFNGWIDTVDEETGTTTRRADMVADAVSYTISTVYYLDGEVIDEQTAQEKGLGCSIGNGTEASEGESMSASIACPDGYAIDSITAIGADGSVISNVESFQMPAADVTITVAYKTQSVEPPVETATVTYLGVEGAFETKTFTVNIGDPTPEFTPTVSEGFEGGKFIGWEPEVAETVTGDATYTAKFQKDEEPEKQSYELKLVIEAGAGKVSAKAPGMKGNKIPEGSRVSMTLTPASGYEVESVSVVTSSGASVSVEDNAFEMPGDNAMVRIRFKKASSDSGKTDGSGSSSGNSSGSSSSSGKTPGGTSNSGSSGSGTGSSGSSTTGTNNTTGTTSGTTTRITGTTTGTTGSSSPTTTTSGRTVTISNGSSTSTTSSTPSKSTTTKVTTSTVKTAESTKTGDSRNMLAAGVAAFILGALAAFKRRRRA